MQENFEIHQWKDDKIPFIYHLDSISGVRGMNRSNWHENIELLYVIEGSGAILCDSVRYTAAAGDFFVINSERVHSISSDGSIRYHCLIFDANFCLENGIDAKALVYETHFRDERLAELVNLFVREYSIDQHDLKVAAVRVAALQIILHLSRYHLSEKNEKVKKRSNAIIQGALNFINASYREKIDLDTIAKSVNVSKFYFEREFKKYTGYSVITYINILRCRTAKGLLKHSDASISEIARSCGFESPSYFSKIFLKYVGSLPSKYRQEQ